MAAAPLLGRRAALVLFLAFSFSADALRHESAPAPGSTLAFAGAPAADLRLRHGEARKGVCGMQMQQLPRDEGTSEDKLLRRGEFGGETGASGSAAPADYGGPGPWQAEREGAMLASRRSAIGVGLGLVLGPMVPMLATALTGEPAAHAATGAAAQPGDGDKKPFVQKSLSEVLQKAGSRALGGGRSGAAAGVLQVLSLMWLRTTMNYQYRYGGSTTDVLKKLYGEGGIGRFYRGIGFALLQQPLSRFGDTAANAGMGVLLDSFEVTSNLPVFVKTVSASAAAALWRIGLMPVDSFKTTLQVDGKDGVQTLLQKMERRGIGVLFDGSAATLGSTFVGHYPWFATFNTLQVNPLALNKLKRRGSEISCTRCINLVGEPLAPCQICWRGLVFM